MRSSVRRNLAIAFWIVIAIRYLRTPSLDALSKRVAQRQGHYDAIDKRNRRNAGYTKKYERGNPTRNRFQRSPQIKTEAARAARQAALVTQWKKDHNSTIDFSDSIFKREGWDNDPIVIESHKLLFFTVPKNSCSVFKMLFRRMMGHKDWKTVGSKSEKLHHPQQNGLRYLGSYPFMKQAEFMESPEWTRAIFLRDPRERVLSAYMDKGLGAYKETNNVAGGYVKNHCCGIKRNLKKLRQLHAEQARLEEKNKHCLPMFPFEKNNTAQTFPFRDFVVHFMKECKDPHWAPQSDRMTKRSWESINFVGHLEHLQTDGHRLLRKLGNGNGNGNAFEEFGKEGWGPSGGPIFETNNMEHATSASTKTDRVYDNNDTDIERLVLHFYRKDYERPIMNMTKPERWDQLMGDISNSSNPA